MKPEDLRNKRLDETIDRKALLKSLREENLTAKDIAIKFNVPLQVVEDTISDMESEKVMINKIDDKYSILDSPVEGGKYHLDPSMWRGDKLRFGFTSDNHMCSHFERNDVLNLIYDVCEGEGIGVVLNGGNWIDGEARFNKNEIHTVGFENQIMYAAKNYPYREGIQTWFVSGDDHEGWYNQRDGINSGDRFQDTREKLGMFDMKHLGYVEADIDLNEGNFDQDSWLRVMHAGGGSSYATSYSAQKIVESLQGGEKPSVLMIGHYHKLLYAYIRNVHTVQMGCFTGNTSIRIKNGYKRIRDIQIGDEVLTHKGRYRKVSKLMTPRYSSDFFSLNFGRKGRLDQTITATSEHPILIERNNVIEWVPIKDVIVGDNVFVSGKKCPETGKIIPYYINYDRSFNPMHRKVTRDKLSKIKGGFKRNRSGNGSGSIHYSNDIIPYCDELIKDGFVAVPVGADVVPDIIAFKDGKVYCIEVEKSKGNYLEFKKGKYDNHIINKYIDEIKWVDISSEPKESSRHSNYEEADNGFVKVPVLSVNKIDIIKRKRKREKVYNFEVEEDNSYVAGNVVVHNCTQDQSIFMRKKKIEAHVGGGIIEFNRASDGTINRCRVEFITAFDKKFYVGKDKYWKAKG